ncbi:chaplin [Streptantibioticus ferralitis]|uniref:Chaplin n=1 Tax=Streptantibioticus ferralitis TaxID=236510 RepID=A0ABT5Z766_9ACTN|nr:chaplin [Streptantibioticus ferralitis]MDF2259653.1 chaplin [Streptantibioticus ferralitis]
MRQVAKKGLITVVATGGVLAVTGGGYAFADAGASGTATGSPGVLSGNAVQAPVSVPVNACGNTVNVVGALNPAFGNHCANGSQHHEGGAYGHTGQGQGDYGHGLGGHDHGGYQQSHQHSSGSHAHGVAEGSPGVGSGNVVQAPVSVPVNACGNSVDAVGVLNPTFGNSCENSGGPDTGQSYTPPPPAAAPPPQAVTPPSQGHRPHGPSHHGSHRPHGPSHHGSHRPAQPGHQVMSPAHPVSTTAAPTLAHTGADQLGSIGAASAGLLVGGYVLYRRGRAARR